MEVGCCASVPGTVAGRRVRTAPSPSVAQSSSSTGRVESSEASAACCAPTAGPSSDQGTNRTWADEAPPCGVSTQASHVPSGENTGVDSARSAAVPALAGCMASGSTSLTTTRPSRTTVTASRSSSAVVQWLTTIRSSGVLPGRMATPLAR